MGARQRCYAGILDSPQSASPCRPAIADSLSVCAPTSSCHAAPTLYGPCGTSAVGNPAASEPLPFSTAPTNVVERIVPFGVNALANARDARSSSARSMSRLMSWNTSASSPIAPMKAACIRSSPSRWKTVPRSCSRSFSGREAAASAKASSSLSSRRSSANRTPTAISNTITMVG